MKIAKVVLVISLLLGIVLAVAWRAKQPKSTAPDRSSAARPLSAVLPPRTSVALVNSVPVTAGELQEEVDRLLPPTGSHGHTGEQQKAELRQRALGELVVRELAYQKAISMHLQPDPAELKATIEKIKGRYKTAQSFQTALRAEEITEAEFVHRVEKDLLLRKIHRLEIDDKATVNEAEARTYYDHNRPRFVRPESIRLWHMVVKKNPKDPDAARKKIYEALGKLKAGEAFDAVAYRYSEDDYRVLGGDYGTVHRGQLIPELEKIAFTAGLHTLTGPFQTSAGWHIVRVDGREPEVQRTFSEVKDGILASLRQKRLAQRKADFVRELKTGASIRYL